jgi:hypothetical protein
MPVPGTFSNVKWVTDTYTNLAKLDAVERSLLTPTVATATIFSIHVAANISIKPTELLQ